MDLALSEDQRLLVDSAERLLVAAASSARTRAAAASPQGIDHPLWQQMGALGWCGVHSPEALGGLGLGLVELVLLQEQLGRRLACVPFLDSVVTAASLLSQLVATEAHADTASAHLLHDAKRIADGTCIATAALDDSREAGQCLAATPGDGWLLTGHWSAVGSAAQADLLLLPVSDASGQPCLFAVQRAQPGVHVVSRVGLDTTRRQACVSMDRLRLEPQALLARGASLQAALMRTRTKIAIGLAAEQLGVAQQCLDLTVSYTQDRVQFGQPVGRFQAVKHRCAQMMVAVENARSAVYGAAAQHDRAAPSGQRESLAALAFVEATEAAQFCAQEAIQLHGGAGFTWEYDPQLYFKRAQANSLRSGSVSAWCERVATELLGEFAR